LLCLLNLAHPIFLVIITTLVGLVIGGLGGATGSALRAFLFLNPRLLSQHKHILLRLLTLQAYISIFALQNRSFLFHLVSLPINATIEHRSRAALRCSLVGASPFNEK
jgi:hypothetical protein